MPTKHDKRKQSALLERFIDFRADFDALKWEFALLPTSSAHVYFSTQVQVQNMILGDQILRLVDYEGYDFEWTKARYQVLKERLTKKIDEMGDLKIQLEDEAVERGQRVQDGRYLYRGKTVWRVIAKNEPIVEDVDGFPDMNSNVDDQAIWNRQAVGVTSSLEQEVMDGSDATVRINDDVIHQEEAPQDYGLEMDNEEQTVNKTNYGNLFDSQSRDRARVREAQTKMQNYSKNPNRNNAANSQGTVARYSNNPMQKLARETNALHINDVGGLVSRDAAVVKETDARSAIQKIRRGPHLEYATSISAKAAMTELKNLATIAEDKDKSKLPGIKVSKFLPVHVHKKNPTSIRVVDAFFSTLPVSLASMNGKILTIYYRKMSGPKMGRQDIGIFGPQKEFLAASTSNETSKVDAPASAGLIPNNPSTNPSSTGISRKLHDIYEVPEDDYARDSKRQKAISMGNKGRLELSQKTTSSERKGATGLDSEKADRKRKLDVRRSNHLAKAKGHWANGRMDDSVEEWKKTSDQRKAQAAAAAAATVTFLGKLEKGLTTMLELYRQRERVNV